MSWKKVCPFFRLYNRTIIIIERHEIVIWMRAKWRGCETWRNYSWRRASWSLLLSSFPCRRSWCVVPPRMIPSRTVFNHCKWIYIELAITGAHSGMGPLCISPAPTPAARARANVFPISSLRATNCSNPSTPGIVPSPTSPLCSSFLSHSLFLSVAIPILFSLSLCCHPLDIAFFFLL